MAMPKIPHISDAELALLIAAAPMPGKGRTGRPRETKSLQFVRASQTFQPCCTSTI
jgi:hypothetical protein